MPQWPKFTGIARCPRQLVFCQSPAPFAVGVVLNPMAPAESVAMVSLVGRGKLREPPGMPSLRGGAGCYRPRHRAIESYGGWPTITREKR